MNGLTQGLFATNGFTNRTFEDGCSGLIHRRERWKRERRRDDLSTGILRPSEYCYTGSSIIRQ